MKKVLEESVRVSSGMKTKNGHWLKDIVIFGDHKSLWGWGGGGQQLFQIGLRNRKMRKWRQ